jgi:hypothetical protein
VIVAYITGGLTALFMYALFSSKQEEFEVIEDSTELEDVPVGNFSNRIYELSCQTCRKLTNHKEVEFKVYSCCRCKRRTYLNAS